MNRRLFALALLASLAACSPPANQTIKPSAVISGAGATFPAPIYMAWAQAYQKDSGMTLNYQAIGSGGGIKQIEAGTVDFGASDKPLKPEDLEKNGLYQFPAVMGGVVPIVNLSGIAPGQLKLTGQVAADIFQGKIAKWNDPAIAQLNPGIALPSSPITVVHRSDGSGTTFLFTTYLASQSPDWQSKVGASDTVEWPVGLGGKGNDGVAAFVKQTDGSIGYVEYAYARKNGGAYTLLQNQSGQYPAPGAESFSAAAEGADWAKAPGNYLLLINQKGEKAWPITGATFVLIHRDQRDPAKGAAVLKFYDWAYQNGDAGASSLDYVPMPAAVKSLVRKQWAGITASGKPVYTSSNP